MLYSTTMAWITLQGMTTPNIIPLTHENTDTN